jgi:ABC-2 type transport system permease protein
MSRLGQELRLFLRQRLAVPTLALLALLAAVSVAAGVTEIRRQAETIARIQPLQAAEEAVVAAWVSRDGDAGNAAYYTFHATWDRPSALAFAALGQRDVAPYVLRVRALALESQIHEGETYNAELALPGRFDWAFVLTFLAPLILIVLLHDLISGEREAGRLQALQAAGGRTGLWTHRAGLRAGLVFVAVAAPFIAGAAMSGASAVEVLGVLAVAGLYLAFWTLVCLGVGALGRGSVANGAVLAATWVVLTLVLPALAHIAINSANPVRQGVELTLAQREAVHAGWDKPKDATLAAFFKVHPEWRDTPPVTSGFHWKWYYAFQHLGDLSVADTVRAYRRGLESRDAWTARVGLVLPAVGVQTALHRMAGTDLAAQLAYQDRIRAFHERLRRFYYPYIFNETPFREGDFAKAPRWAEGD